MPTAHCPLPLTYREGSEIEPALHSHPGESPLMLVFLMDFAMLDKPDKQVATASDPGLPRRSHGNGLTGRPPLRH
jgi:hypothetical protein